MTGSDAIKDKVDWEKRFELFQTKNMRYYPRYHLAPVFGWMNDPNGLIFYNGLYHAFYQHYPYKAEWGPMHWGHATSPDMVHWTHQFPALWPTENSADADGCFSGSAVIDSENNLCLIYTGHRLLPTTDENGSPLFEQVQCLAVSEDGFNFNKCGEVLHPPKGIMHFRDPKVWFEDDAWWMVLGVSDKSQEGQVYLYRSMNLREWEFVRILLPDVSLGYMWECPDFFSLNDKHILTFSPQGIQAKKGYYQRNIFDCGFIRGRLENDKSFSPETDYKSLDFGHDYYAAQSFLAADGRRIVMAWMDMWENAYPSASEGWAGALTLPRELILDADNNLLIRPIEELKILRAEQQIIAPQKVSHAVEISDAVKAQEWIVKWDLKQSQAERYGIKLGSCLNLFIDTQSERLILDRAYPNPELCGARSIALPECEILTLQIFFDCSSVEVFVNQGEAVLTSRIYPDDNDRCAYLYAEAGDALFLEGQIWDLKNKA